MYSNGVGLSYATQVCVLWSNVLRQAWTALQYWNQCVKPRNCLDLKSASRSTLRHSKRRVMGGRRNLMELQGSLCCPWKRTPAQKYRTSPFKFWRKRMRSRRESPLLPYTTANKLPSRVRTKSTSTLKRSGISTSCNLSHSTLEDGIIRVLPSSWSTGKEKATLAVIKVARVLITQPASDFAFRGGWSSNMK